MRDASDIMVRAVTMLLVFSGGVPELPQLLDVEPEEFLRCEPFGAVAAVVTGLELALLRCWVLRICRRMAAEDGWMWLSWRGEPVGLLSLLLLLLGCVLLLVSMDGVGVVVALDAVGPAFCGCG